MRTRKEQQEEQQEKQVDQQAATEAHKIFGGSPEVRQ